MKIILLTVTIPLLWFNFYLGADSQQTKASMIEELGMLKHQMSLKYAPKEWKETLFGWNLETAFDDACAQIMNSNEITTSDFHHIAKNFLGSTRDFHVKPLFFSREQALFPLEVQAAEGKYFLNTDFFFELSLEDALLLDDDSVNEWEEQMAQMTIPDEEIFETGDELIAFNNIPVAQVIDQILEEEMGGDHSATSRALALKMLFSRLGKYGHRVPQGTFTISYLKTGREHPITLTLPWLYFSEPILNKIPKAPLALPQTMGEIKQLARKNFQVAFAKDLMRPSAFSKYSRGEDDEDFDGDDDDFADDDDFDDDYFSDNEKGFLPELGKVIWRANSRSPFYAYLYKNEQGKKIGYIYLPTFDLGDFDETEENMLIDLIDILQKFENESDALVFDITNNPGGYWHVMTSIASMLSPKPLAATTDSLILSHSDVHSALLMQNLIAIFYSEEDEDAEEIKQFMTYFNQIIETWKQGERMTEPMYIFGQKEIAPHNDVQYSKPILLLINELDFSCADFFPAILQDNQRATLFGAKTAGAGGSVRGYSFESRFGIKAFSMTGSIGYRLDGTPLENLGVTPDIPYQLSKRDLEQNYVDYVEAVNRAVNELLKQSY